MKYSIKKRLQIILTALTCISIIVCVLAAFFYSNRQLRKHILSNEQRKLEIIASELDDISTDVQQIGMLLAFDEYIQEYFGEEEMTISRKIDLQQSIKNRVKNFILQRDYIVNFVLVKEGRILVSNSQHSIYASESDYEDLMKKEEYSLLSDERVKFQYGPSYRQRLHAQTRDGGMQFISVMPYIVDVSDKDNVREKIGRILVNVGYEYVYERIESALEDTDDFLFYDSYKEEIYQMRNNMLEKEKEELLETLRLGEKEPGKVFVCGTKRGYGVCYESRESGWFIVSYISTGTIFRQSEGLIILYSGIAFLMILIVIIISRRIADSITHPIIALTDTMQEITEGNMDSRAEIMTEDEIGVLAKKFNAMVTELNASYEKNLALEKERRTIELNLLSAQINPHFIYNTLQTIIYLAAKKDHENVMGLTRSFIGLLQNTVKISEKMLEVELAQEIEVVKEYIEILNFRYNGKFTAVWDIAPGTEKCFVPKTSLQPIVENSFLHGIFHVQNGQIVIRTYFENEALCVVVEDNGIGMSPEKIQELLENRTTNWDSMRTIGIPNVISRIQYLYGEKYGVWIESEVNHYTKITMKTPGSSENRTE